MFQDRADAGRQLVEKLAAFRGDKQVVVLGLVRGGVVIADEVAKGLGANLDIIVARKIGAPMNPELGIGAVAGDVSVYNDEYIRQLDVPQMYLKEVTKEKQQEAKRKLKMYRKGRPPLDLSGKIVILVDDGIATGITMDAAIAFVRAQKPAKLIVAVPVAPPERLKRVVADEKITLLEPRDMMAVGQFYLNFSQVEDDEVIAILERAWKSK